MKREVDWSLLWIFAAAVLALCLLAGCASMLPRNWFSGAAASIPKPPPGPSGAWMLIAGGIVCIIGAAVLFALFKTIVLPSALGVVGILLIVLDFVGATQIWLLDVTYGAALLGLGFVIVDSAIKSRTVAVVAKANAALGTLDAPTTSAVTKAVETLAPADAAAAKKVLGL
jgi:hypothetical protein